MPNQHHPDKEVLGFYLDRRLAAKVRRMARLTKQPITQLLTQILSTATHDIVLTTKDREEIAQRKSRKLQHQSSKQPRRKGAEKRTGR
jgi:hypothetical protein